MSSTQVRLHLKRDMSVRYLIPECVIDYIEENGLYQNGGQGQGNEKEAAGPGKGRGRDGGESGRGSTPANELTSC
jgi:nicotinamide mononucleotide adenylyltransferase